MKNAFFVDKTICFVNNCAKDFEDVFNFIIKIVKVARQKKLILMVSFG